MGFGGKATLIGCKITAANRLPASFFVSVAYECWAFRRLGVRLDAVDGAITQWLYRDPDRPVEAMAATAGFALTGREVVLTPPITEEQVRALRVGDIVLITGRMFTGRDNVHHYLMHNPPPVDLQGAALYHCGPVMLKEGDKWTVKAAGPTTSIREEPYQGEIIRRYGVRAVIGKGGMGSKTLAALKDFGAVYLNGIGGAAQYYARTIKEVLGVHLMEFGIPEAMWHLRVENFAAIVTMDAHGNSLHAEVEKARGEALAAIPRETGLKPLRVAEFVRPRDELEIHLARHVGLPIAHPPRVAYEPDEDHRHSRCQGPGGYPPPLSRGHVERAFGRADRHTVQAPEALGRTDGNQLVYLHQRRTCLGAFSAVDTRLRIAADAERAQQRYQPGHGAVRAQIAAPEVLDENRCRDQDSQRDRRCDAHEPEEVEHLHVGYVAVRAVQELPDLERGHAPNCVQKQG
jgi:tartrate/fumarate subfamily iron-sulfur-dependent hydro-lyase beta chain